MIRQDGMIGGVCAGLAHRMNVDATWVRLGLALLALASFGLAIWFYVILWVITPTAHDRAPLARWIERIQRIFGSDRPRRSSTHEVI